MGIELALPLCPLWVGNRQACIRPIAGINAKIRRAFFVSASFFVYFNAVATFT